jgi:hypothetical protein
LDWEKYWASLPLGRFVGKGIGPLVPEGSGASHSDTSINSHRPILAEHHQTSRGKCRRSEFLGFVGGWKPVALKMFK